MITMNKLKNKSSLETPEELMKALNKKLKAANPSDQYKLISGLVSQNIKLAKEMAGFGDEYVKTNKLVWAFVNAYND